MSSYYDLKAPALKATLVAFMMLSVQACSSSTPEDGPAIAHTSAALQGGDDLVMSMNAAADTHVKRWLPFRNFGSRAHLKVDGQSLPDSIRTLVRFDQQQLEDAVNENLDDMGLASATLRLTINPFPALSWGGGELTLHRLKRSWTESGATWANVFGLTGLRDSHEAEPSARVPIALGQTGTVELDVTGDVIHFLENPAENHGWVLLHRNIAAGVVVSFGSRESSSPPELELAFVEADAPTTETVFEKGEPGHLLIDASEGKLAFTVPGEGMVFDSLADLAHWAEEHLNAEIIEDEDGAVVGAQLAVDILDTPYDVDMEARTVTPVDDPVAALVGGRKGIVTVGGTEFCLREDGCLDDDLTLKSQPPSSAFVCDFSGTNCIGAGSSTFRTPLINIYQTIGTSVKQEIGGYQRNTRWCWNFLKLFRCSRPSGSNIMSVMNTFRVSVKDFPDLFVSRAEMPPLERSNVTSLSQTRRSFGFKVDGKLQFEGISFLEGMITGTCGQSSSLVGANLAEAATSAGNVQEVCDFGTLPPR